MGKRWTAEEDQFLCDYYDSIGDYVGVHDLGRPKGSATKRVKYLKECGAWDALRSIRFYEKAYRKAVGIKVDGDIDENIFIRAGVREDFRPGLRVVK